jgi:hypothetical protein
MSAKGNMSHMEWYFGTHELLCFRCGDRFSVNSVLPNSLDALLLTFTGFYTTHKRCKKNQAAGTELKAWREKDWQTFRESRQIDG